MAKKLKEDAGDASPKSSIIKIPKKIKKSETKYEKILVTLPRYSRTLKIMRRKQFDADLIKDFNSIMLKDGTILRQNGTYEVDNTDEVKALIKNGSLIPGGNRRRIRNV